MNYNCNRKKKDCNKALHENGSDLFLKILTAQTSARMASRLTVLPKQ